MKKIIVGFMVVCMFVLAACSGGSAPAKNVTADPAYQKGQALVASNDCLTCHQVNTSGVGPAYTDVANKYDNTDANVDMLAQKIINGGSGHWGTTPMAAHPSLSQDDAKAIARYILLQRTK